MLVLSRKKNESIVINNNITIVVVEIRGDKVRLGIEAPREIPVHRREVYEAIQRNELSAKNKAASEQVGDADFDADVAAAAKAKSKSIIASSEAADDDDDDLSGKD